jgi:5-dehydro-2-deoxygluconokinase
MALAAEDFDEAFIASSKALVITGTHFSTPSTDAACQKAIEFAQRNGTRTVLDIDYRPVLWGLTALGDGEVRFVAAEDVSMHLQAILPLFDLVVGTEDEIHIAGGCTDTIDALCKIRQLSKATLVVKLGAAGCAFFPEDIPDTMTGARSVPGIGIEVVNVLGAGDAFMSGFMRGWINHDSLEKCGRYANASGALVVSRHGCAPAMPTRRELDYFLSRTANNVAAGADDCLHHLHHTTTRTNDWDEIYVLAFDHRSQFIDMADRYGAEHDRIRAIKALIARASAKVTEEAGLLGRAGILVDDRFGQSVLENATGSGLWIGRPVEVPGSRPLQFEQRGNVGLHILTWPSEHVVKCLVSYHPDDDDWLRRTQLDQLSDLFRACRIAGNEMLLEVIPPTDLSRTDSTVVESMRQIYMHGIRPDWWKLQSQSPAAWRNIDDIISNYDADCRGIVLLGLDVPVDELVEGFRDSANCKYCRGFAVGRTIFGEPARAWFAGEADDETTVDRIAQNYLNLVRLWQGSRPLDRAVGESS